MDFIHRTAEGQNLSAQDKRGALSINPSGVFFTLFLRSFILLRELECVVGASVVGGGAKSDPTVREGFCRFAIHTQAWSSPREEGLRYKSTHRS
jgi:hypothetical protein